jgi:hypothetical protein
MVTQHKFTFEGEAYRIRSISSEAPGVSCNELIGKNVLAVDFDKDRIIDRIVLGDLALSEAQKIYEYGLDMLAQNKKLQQQSQEITGYVYETFDFYYEIRSFQPANTDPFNEFKLSGKRQAERSEVSIVVDHLADGTLDEVLKGKIELEQAQSRYSEMIRLGLKKGNLIQSENTIVVKSKR